MRATAVILSLFLVGTATAQPPAGRLRPEGTEFFRAVLQRAGARSLSGVEELHESPGDKVLIVFGDTSRLDGMISSGDFQRFLNNHGSICLATDQATSRDFQDFTGIQVAGVFVQARRSKSYRTEMIDCPVVVDHLGDAQRHAIFSSLPNPSRGVATNRPSFVIRNDVVRRRMDLTLPVAWLPVNGPYRIFEGREQTLPLVLAVANSAKSTHLLVIADHSIFINDMMSQPDNDNTAFAYGVVRWLTDGGRRKEVLFIDNGDVQTEFSVSLDFPQPRVPPLEALVPLANEAIVAVERENFINQTLLDVVGGPWPILRTVLFLLTLALLAFGLYRFMQARHRPDARPSPTAVSTAAGLTAVERRHRAVIAQGNLAEAARELAHQTFATVGLTPSVDIPPPTVVVNDRVPFRGWWWDRHVRRLWKLAVRGPRRPVSPAALRRLDASVHHLLAAVAAGRVRLASSRSAI